MPTSPTITRAQFLARFSDGLDLSDPSLAIGARKAGLAPGRLERFDKDLDGRLCGGELRRAFRLLDSFDHDGSARSFVTSGKAGTLYRAFEATDKMRSMGLGTAIAALSRAQHMGADYAFEGAPTSPHPRLSNNREPGVTRLTWLQGRNKCNQFVGDALTEAGVAMPTYRMRDGSLHYMNAEALPAQQSYFARLTSAAQLSPGDVVVVDYPEPGLGGAHAEIVSGYSAGQGKLFTTGAHASGAYERDWSDLLDGSTFDVERGCWQRPDGSSIYLLRPIRRLEG